MMRRCWGFYQLISGTMTLVADAGTRSHVTAVWLREGYPWLHSFFSKITINRSKLVLGILWQC